MGKEKKDKCVMCGEETPYTKDIPVNLRHYYVDGGGQLCRDCYEYIYKGIEV
jgi:hypothetical protein